MARRASLAGKQLSVQNGGLGVAPRGRSGVVRSSARVVATNAATSSRMRGIESDAAVDAATSSRRRGIESDAAVAGGGGGCRTSTTTRTTLLRLWTHQDSG